jgi:60 kDa SS-A/Ro ribonucleoprotein
MLAGLDLLPAEWKVIARNASWQTTRMNLNTLLRHGVLKDEAIVSLIAKRLGDPQQIKRARALPYQLMIAHAAVAAEMPTAIRNALHAAMEIAVSSVPKIDGKVFVFPDISGSMHSPLTGHRKGATTAVRCVDVAALISAAVLRVNPNAEVIPFESKAIPPETVRLSPYDSVMTNAARLAALPCGGTNCSAPLAYLNGRKATGDLVIYVSDNESWVDSPRYGTFGGGATATMREWAAFKQRSPRARMVCIDLQPYGTTQAKERDDILNVGGFSDQVFEFIAAVASGRATAGHWVGEIEAVTL